MKIVVDRRIESLNILRLSKHAWPRGSLEKLLFIIAGRIASAAQPGCIQADGVTYRRLHNRDRFDDVHQIQVKGKGVMQASILRGELAADESLGEAV